MGLEVGSFIDDLVATNPLSTDKRKQGDDHLRLIKSVLKGTFPVADHAIYLEQAEVSVASAGTVDLGAEASNNIEITGTTTITSFGTVAEGVLKFVRFAGALTLTHNATSLILPGGANITTAAGDVAAFKSLGGGNWRCLFYTKAAGVGLADIADADIVTESEGIASNDNDTTIPTSAAVHDHVVGQQTVWLPAQVWVPEDGAAGPELATVAGTNLDYKELLFDGASTETAFFEFQLPKGIDPSADFVFEVAYASKGTSSGNVRWAIDAVVTGDGDTIDAALGTQVADDSAAGAVANVEQRSGELTVTPAGTIVAEDILRIRLQRLGGHANDTNTDDVGLIGVRCHITVSSPTDD